MKLFIKNMLGQRSRSRVLELIVSFGLHPLLAEMGEIEVKERLSLTSYNALKQVLLREEFDLLNDREIILVEKIRYLVIEMIHFSDEIPEINYSDYISRKLKVNYTYLSKCFSKIKGITIEQYIIAHKIEKIKRLLFEDEFTISEIAWRLHYSSTAHLSAQFKKVTGITPSLFKKSDAKDLTPITKL